MGLERGTQSVVTAAVFNALALFFILIRCISRFWIVGQVGPEDHLIIFALVLSIGFTVTVALQSDHGLGRHIDTVSNEDGEILSKLLYASIILYNFGLFLVKGSILYQYLRFFTEKRYRYAAWFLIGFVFVGGTAFILANCFACKPVAFFWDKSIEGGHCFNREGLWFSFSGFNILTDFLTWLLPMPVLWRLHLPRKQKMSLIGVFALGGFACITGLLRLNAIYITSRSTDITYHNVSAATWSAAELNVGIICACLPATRPIISLIFPHLLSTTRREHSSHLYPQRGTYMRNESIVELSQVVRPQSEASKDDRVSFDQENESNAIRVKTEWTITEKERV